MKSLATAITDPQHTPKGIQMKNRMRYSVLRENRQHRALVRYISGKAAFRIDSCIFPYIEKH